MPLSLLASPTATLQRELEVVDSADWGYDPAARARWRPGYGYYPKQAGCSLDTAASSQALWQTVQQLGGEEGYFYANILWRIRARMDYMIGNGVVYGRPARASLALGDERSTGGKSSRCSRCGSWRCCSA